MRAAADPLTGLPQRVELLDTLQCQLEQAREQQTMLALLLIDVDRMGLLNAAYGFAAGDQLLVALAEQLRALQRAQDTLGRVGDNRFALLLPRPLNRGHVELAAEKLLRRLEAPLACAGQDLRVRVSLGLALFPLDAADAESMLRAAEFALVGARASGLRYAHAAEQAESASQGSFWQIAHGLDHALQRNEISLYYQPKFRLSGLKWIGLEALMRWAPGGGELVSPARFIPVAEQTGQIRELTLWALNTALRYGAQWSREFGFVSVAVNVPAEMVADEQLPGWVEEARRLWANDTVQLVLEITERSLMADPQRSFRVLSALRAQGVKISIDDFGTGYSCLAYFRDLPADELKIDPSFVAGLCNDPANAGIAELVIALAHRFGMKVVGEGVENQQTLSALIERGCDMAQGYLLGRPMSPAQLQQWVRGKQ